MTDRRFGVELEFIARYGVTRDRVAEKLCQAGVPTYAASYSDHRVVPGKWKIKPDGSLRGGNGMELVSPPISGEEGYQAVIKASAILLDSEVDAKINTSCGLHVHVDAGELDLASLKRLAVIYIENEKVIDSFLPPSRRGETNVYAKSLRNADVSKLKAARSADEIASAMLPREFGHMRRYVKLNFMPTHGTVEFRHHSGTTDAIKINQWVKICQQMIDVAIKEKEVPIAASPSRPSRMSSQMRIVFDMISRQEGASTEELQAALGRRHRFAVGYWLRQYNVAFRRSRRRYYIDDRALIAMAPATLESFMTKLEMSDEQKSFLIARVEHLRGTMEIRP